MKKVKLYAMAFAAMIFAASCQDDLTDPGQNTGNGGDGTPAYLTLSFTANAGSSTRAADDGLNTGDTDGDAEDSGHHSAGDNHESDVNSALVVVAPVNGNVGFAKLYSATTVGDLTGPNENGQPGEGTDTDGFKITDDASKTYYNATPIEVATGEYKILVVINPVKEITDGLGTGSQLESGPEVNALYDFIVTGQYQTTGGLTGSTEGTKYCDDLADTSEGGDGFMMANKAESTVELTEAHTPTNPASASVTVERVVSKITYRTKATNNIYEVDVPGVVKANTVIGYVKTSDLDAALGINTTEEETEEEGDEEFNIAEYTPVILNEALDIRKIESESMPQTVWAYFKHNNPSEDQADTKADKENASDFVAAFGRTSQTYTVPATQTGSQTRADVVEGETYYIYEKLTPVTQENYTQGDKEYVVSNTSSPEESLTLQSSADDYDTWYVQLVGYALVNLSKDVYYVRHTTGGLTGNEPFGELVGSNYLYTSHFTNKSTVAFVQDDENKTTTFPTGVDPENWFYNTLAKVSEESETLTYSTTDGFKSGDSSTTATYFQKFPTGEGDDVTNDETITGDSPQHPSGEGTPEKTGARMAYVFENSVMADHQVHGLTTGIVFAAQIYKTNSNGSLSDPANGLYYYQNHIFESLEDIAEAYNLTIPDNATKEQLAELGITQFTNNMCYYYTSRIKHFDNANPTDMGIMEFAIMRNNIYSLAVTGISEIGTPIVDPTPDTPNESKQAALNLEVTMEPWIVRYNDIEF